MIPREILRKIRQIELRSIRLVNETLAGQYHSVFKGQGMNFDEVREYQPGDEVRSIDWNVTARMNHPFVKKFVEERELTLMLVVDVSGSPASGRDTVRRLRRWDNGHAVRIVAHTGWTQDEARANAHEVGCDEYLVKPVAVEMLRRSLCDPVAGPCPRR